MIRLAFLVRSLDAGGAERQLVQLATQLDKSVFDVTVITYYPGGALESEFVGTPGVRLISAGKRGRYDVVGFLTRLARLVRHVRPHIVHGYMWGANELAWLLGRINGSKVVWGVRASDMDMSHYDLAFALLTRTGAWFSSHADLIVVNSEAGRLFHGRLGYDQTKMLVIPNGIDVTRFRRDPEARARLRREWRLSNEEIAIGVVARLDPMKDHDTFLTAASLLTARVPSARFLVVGSGSAAYRQRLAHRARRLGVHERVLWVGARHDMPAVYSALDIAVSSSAFGEGFSNALAEAMACEVPCVTTDVGDAAIVVGEFGRIVPRRRPDLLADAIANLAAADPTTLGRQARERVAGEFSLEALAERTTAALCGLVPTSSRLA